MNPLGAHDTAALADRRLAAVRVMGAGVTGWFGQLAIQMPGGYFGPSDRVTTFGSSYGIAVLVLALLCAAGEWRSARWSRFAVPMLIVLNVAVFGPALADDPLVAISVVAWQLFLLGRHLFPSPASAFEVASAGSGIPDPKARAWLERWRGGLAHALWLSTICALGVVGFRLTDLAIGPLSCLVLATFVLALAAPLLLQLARRRPQLRWLFIAGVLSLLPFWNDPRMLVGILCLYQGLLLVYVMLRGPVFGEVLRLLFERPALLLVAAFGGTSLLGAIVLTFPAASATGTRIAFVDALFTATSAVCVTGLIVLDTPVDFTTFGHVVILMLIQIGGLGIMVLSTFATVALGGRLGLRGEHALEQILDVSTPRRAYRLARFIVFATLSIEAFGAVVIAFGYRMHDFDWLEALWRGLFHSISAFCNAGFALQSDSISMFRGQPGIMITFSLLVMAGGLGFVVLAWLWQRITRRGHDRDRASVQIRIVLVVTILLLVIGFAMLCVIEWNRSLALLSPGDKLVNAFFQSVTTRTAGFNSIEFSQMHPSTLLGLMVLMFIGAAPGSTGGGIKVTTFAVLIAAIPAIARGQVRATIFRREVDAPTILRASTIVVLASVMLFSSMFVLLSIETQPFVVLAFEAVSALGTVGLSLGATPELSVLGKATLIMTMVIGRLGPLSVALLLARRTIRHYSYPAARIMVG